MPNPNIPEAYTSFLSYADDGSLRLTITIPTTETQRIAGHDFVIDNTKVPLASHILRYTYGGRKLNDVAGGAAKIWRDESNVPVGTAWPREESAHIVNAYLNGTLAVRASYDATANEARRMALAYILRSCGCATAKAGHTHPKARAYFKDSAKLGKVRDDAAIDAFIARFDAAQAKAGKPELGFLPRAREIVATRNAETADGAADNLI